MTGPMHHWHFPAPQLLRLDCDIEIQLVPKDDVASFIVLPMLVKISSLQDLFIWWMWFLLTSLNKNHQPKYSLRLVIKDTSVRGDH
jgi:hypothetical protein